MHRPDTLFGVVVHHGQSLQAGHYVAFVRGPNRLLYQMDDASASQVGLSNTSSLNLTLRYVCAAPHGLWHQMDDVSISQVVTLTAETCLTRPNLRMLVCGPL